MRQPRNLLVLVVMFALLGVLAPTAQGQDATIEELSIFRVYVDDPNDITYLFETGFDVLEARGEGYVLVVSDDAAMVKLRAEGFRVREDQVLDPLAGVPGFTNDGNSTTSAATYNGGYRTVDEHYSNLYAVEASYPALATVVDYGDSWRAVNGRPGGNELLAICLTNRQAGDCALDPSAPKPRAVIMAAIHARELQTSEVAWRLVDELTQGYGIDPDITHILDTTEVWVIPVANPDGREIVELGGNAPYLQRKNANDSVGACAEPPTAFDHHGVDLNRNSSWLWGGINSTNIPCWQQYRGTGPASEPEQQALETLFSNLWPDQKGSIISAAPADSTGVFISIHSYSDLILLPEVPGGVSPNDTELRTFGFRMSDYNNYAVGTGAEILYPITGGTVGWVYGELGVAGFTYELSPISGECSGFTPDYDCIDTNIWPLNREALIYSLKAASAPYVTPRGPTTADVAAPDVVSSGSTFRLDATIDDDALGNAPGSVGRPVAQNVVEAEYYVDVGPDQGGVPTPMVAADSSFDSATEAAFAFVPAAALSIGEHSLLVRGRNADGFWGPLTATKVEVFPGHRIVSPANGDDLCAGDTIVWDGPSSGKYRLRLGTTVDGSDILNQATSATELTVGSVPGGQVIHATLRHRAAGTTSWVLHDQVAYAPCSASPITIVSPNDGSELCAGDTIAWDGPPSGKYRLRLGTTPDGSDVLNQATSATEVTAVALPPAQPLYAALRHRAAGSSSWVLHDQVAFAACAAGAIAIVTPADGSPLCAGDLVGWDGPPSGKYRLRIGTTPDGSDVLNQATSATDLTIDSLPAGQPLFATLRHRAAGTTSWTVHDMAVFNPCPAA